jgi:hypothetical protein
MLADCTDSTALPVKRHVERACGRCLGVGFSDSLADEIVTRYWARHRQWSILADRLKFRITSARKATLALSSTGAVLQTFAAFVPSWWVSKGSAICGTVALVAVPFLTGNLLGAEQVRRWLRARSVSEGLKSEIFCYVAGGKPFDGADRGEKFEAACRDAESWVEELSVELAAIAPDSEAVPSLGSPQDYVASRVSAQIANYYRPKAQRNARLASRFRLFELVVAGVAAVVGAVAGALQLSAAGSKGVGMWVAVLTTIGAAVAAHAAASRFDLQARTFFATARELEDVLGKWERDGKPTDPARWSALVAHCENVISAENRGWMAKLDPQEKKT